MNAKVEIKPERADHPQVVALLGALDRCLGELYEPGSDQREALRLYERCGYTRRGAVGGYPDNGMSLFIGKALA